jgi:GNAT superfamily N-acetyltransferase
MAANTQLRIEQATEEDIPLVLDFIREHGAYAGSVARVTATEEGLRTSLFGPTRYAKTLIAYDGQEPVAYAIYFFSYSSFSGQPNLYLEDIFVRPASRGLGLGKRLFAFLARQASEHNCGRIEWAVLNWNESALAFYKNLGAVPVSDSTVFRLDKEKLEELARLES